MDPHANLQVMPLRRHVMVTSQICSPQQCGGSIPHENYWGGGRCKMGPPALNPPEITKELKSRARRVSEFVLLNWIIIYTSNLLCTS